MEDINDKLKNIDIVDEMENSFLDYAMSVIVSRALPDVRDGLKPVHRRILFAMNQISNHSDKPYQKSARTVGEVIGKYHPHGDTSVYDAMVRMAQDFSYRYELVDGHGNFGSVDGDRAAAMRYTEARMSKLAMFLVADINKKTVDFQPNYDGKEKEPTVLPAKFPNLLVNGGTGIAVGMATNIPPHNLGEVIDALLHLIDNPKMTLEQIMQFIKGPDFPTGGITLGIGGIKKAYETGKGSIVTKAKAEVIDNKTGRSIIVISEIPFQVNKAKTLEKIAQLVREKIILGIAEIRDESNHEGMRIVLEIKKDHIPEIILNKLYKHTNLQASFSFNNVMLVDGEPKRLNLFDTLSLYLKHQVEVITRRTKFDLEKAQKRIHILEGLAIATANIDKVVAIIKESKDPNTAKTNLIKEFSLSEIQAKAILEMKLARLTGLERQKLLDEIKNLEVEISEYQAILNDDDKLHQIIKDELSMIKDKFGDERRTEIDPYGSLSIDDEDLIPKEKIIITLSKAGYVKRLVANTYKSQNRGGKGIKGQEVVEEDSVYKMLVTTTHSDLLFFSDQGKTYRIRAHKVPVFSRQAKGMPVVNLIEINKGEKIKALLSLNQYNDDSYFFFVTEKGIVKKTRSSQYQRVSRKGKIAIALRDDDNLLNVKLTNGHDNILIGNSNGKVVHFSESNVRPSGRKTFGVKGMNIDGGKIISFVKTNPDLSGYLLSVSSKGTGKLTKISEYRKIKRGGKGVKSLKITNKTGQLVGILGLNGDEELLLMSSKGIIIRVRASEISRISRNTQGVKLMNLQPGEVVKNVVVVQRPEQETPGEIEKNKENTHSVN